jgi:hypothetical protein
MLQRSRRTRQAPTITGSDLVVRALARAGGEAACSTVLRAVSDTQGRREAGHAIGSAILGGRVEKTILANGVLGLRLTTRDEREPTR